MKLKTSIFIRFYKLDKENYNIIRSDRRNAVQSERIIINKQSKFKERAIMLCRIQEWYEDGIQWINGELVCWDVYVIMSSYSNW